MATTLQLCCPDIECAGCANAIRRSLGSLDGVKSVEVGIDAKQVTVAYDADRISETALRERLTRAGFPPE